MGVREKRHLEGVEIRARPRFRSPPQPSSPNNPGPEGEKMDFLYRTLGVFYLTLAVLVVVFVIKIFLPLALAILHFLAVTFETLSAAMGAAAGY